MTERTSLDDVLAYSCPDVVDSFLETYAIPREEAEELFLDVKRYLWLRGVGEERGVKVYMSPSLLLMDEMWHTFMLFSPQYSDFCDRFFGHYLHHRPTTVREKAKMREEYENDPAQFNETVRADLRSMIELVVDELGGEIARRWFSTYTKKYTAEFIRSAHKYARALP